MLKSDETMDVSEYVERFAQWRRQGQSCEDALGELRRSGASPMNCIVALAKVEKVGLATAKRQFSESRSWADYVARNDEMLERELEALSPEIDGSVIIFVSLLDEGVPVWRPINAAPMGQDTYRIISSSRDYPDETWQFDEGDVVRCQDRLLSEGPAKVAVAKLPNPGG